MGFSRQEYWSGLSFPPPGDLPDPEIEPRSLALQADSLPSEPPGKPIYLMYIASIYRFFIYIYIYECLYILCIKPNLSIILPIGLLIVFSKKYLMRCEDEIKVHVHVQIRTNHLQNMERGRKWRTVSLFYFLKKLYGSLSGREQAWVNLWLIRVDIC